MKRQHRFFVGLSLVSALTLSFSPRANALPDLIGYETPPGWSYPALPRSSNDASGGSCVLQSPALPGNSSSTWFNGSMRNIGNATASGVFTALYLDDVLKTIQGAYNIPVSGFGTFVNNPSSLVLKGGRHTLLTRADVFGGVTENSEFNNEWSRQYIWSPLALSLGSPVTRTGEPGPWSTGSGPYMNCEGFSGTTTSNQYWYAFAVLGEANPSDYDVTLHTEAPSNVPQAGFGAYTAYSARGSNQLDAVIVDRNWAPSGTYYAGVSQWVGSGNKVVQFEASSPNYFSADGWYGPYTMGSGDIIDMHEILGYSNVLSIQVVPASGAANLDVSLLGAVAGGQQRLNNNVAGGWAASQPAGVIEEMGVTISPGSFYGLAVFKDGPADLSQSCSYYLVLDQRANLVSSPIPPWWSGPIVPRNAPDAPEYVATLPPFLNGNQMTTSFNFSTFNASLLPTAGPFSTQVYLDDLPTWFGPTVAPLPPQHWMVWMNTYTGVGASLVRGGLHYLRQEADAAFEEPESVEWDNNFTDWFVWTPLQLANQAPVVRPAPPIAYPAGSSAYPACDGVRSTYTASFWTAVAAMPSTMTSEYDVLVHSPSTGSKDGFGFSHQWSYDGFTGNPDFCIVNYNAAPFVQHDFSVVNQWGYNDDVYVEQADAPFEMSLSPGIFTLGTFQLEADDILNMHEFGVPAAVAGLPVYIKARNLAGGSDLELWLFDGAVPYHTKFTAMAGINANGPGGDEQLAPVVFPAAGYYALAVNKSKATDMGHGAWYELQIQVGDIPNLITAAAPPGWSAPAVPRNTTDATPTSCILPAQLSGNATTTSFNFSSRNIGTGNAAPTWSTSLFVDDEQRWQMSRTSGLAPSDFALWNNTPQGSAQSLVKGGRHHVRLEADVLAQVLETNEWDNSFTEWFVWTPLELADHVPVLRSAPPYAWPQGSGAYPSVDGVRSNGTSALYWTAVAVMPATMSSEYDMLTHNPSAGSQDGFASHLDWSYDGFPGNPDFCIVNYNLAARTPYDFSVVNPWNYSDGFYVQRADAPLVATINPGVSRLGPYPIGTNEILGIYELYVPPSALGVPVYISANNLSGGVDLELWLFGAGSPFYTKFTAMGGINAAGPGADEHMPPIVFSAPGFHALVVNKSKATDLGHAGTYEIVISTSTSTVDAPVVAPLPMEFALSSPRPNPSSGGTSVELAVPAAQGKATVVVYDLGGRRVKTLVDGEATPGRHLLKWDGRDSSGRKAAAGVYFVRLESARVREVKKVTLLR